MSIETIMPSNCLFLCHPFFSCLQSFPASGSFPMSQLFTPGGQCIGVSASASVLPMNIQDFQQIFRNINEANMAPFLSPKRKRHKSGPHALGSSGPGVGAPRVTRATVKKLREQSPQKKEGAKKRLLRGTWGRREGAWPAFSTCFGTSLDGEWEPGLLNWGAISQSPLFLLCMISPVLGVMEVMWNMVKSMELLWMASAHRTKKTFPWNCLRWVKKCKCPSKRNWFLIESPNPYILQSCVLRKIV